ncbi:MAG TPA: Asp-tRNA(Asn)/Glu-tRNA(Gln) amidotransferase subunit GatC [Candidatus Limnocylindrales bacterium]|nr:Asp-tRNA(Asn)/Glu-tRNA(Gln) amidotransferase subunit GatC [Candidatus Limnocylindrales bacterium]
MKIDVRHVAKLAELPLKDDEINKLEEQLESTLKYIEQLNEVDTNNIEPTSQVTGLENIMRDDIAKESLSQEQATSNSTATHNGLFMVKGILNSG